MRVTEPLPIIDPAATITLRGGEWRVAPARGQVTAPLAAAVVVGLTDPVTGRSGLAVLPFEGPPGEVGAADVIGALLEGLGEPSRRLLATVMSGVAGPGIPRTAPLRRLGEVLSALAIAEVEVVRLAFVPEPDALVRLDTTTGAILV